MAKQKKASKKQKSSSPFGGMLAGAHDALAGRSKKLKQQMCEAMGNCKKKKK